MVLCCPLSGVDWNGLFSPSLPYPRNRCDMWMMLRSRGVPHLISLDSFYNRHCRNKHDSEVAVYAMAAALHLDKEKITPSGVLGKITCMNAHGERVGPWGGTECFLSRQSGVGPCLVVRSSKHKRHEGTFYRLTEVRRVLADYCTQGKLSLVVGHQSQVCTLLIAANSNDVQQLTFMARVLQSPARWGEIELDVARPSSRGAKRNGGGSKVTPTEIREPPGPPLAYTEMSAAAPAAADDDVEDAYLDPNDLVAQQLGLRPSGASTSSAAPSAAKSAPSSVNINGGFTMEQMAATTLVKKGHNVFITGGAGTGKSHWLRHLIDHVLPRNHDSVAVTASTGIAARAIGGQTIHAFAGIGKGDAPFEQLLQRARNRPEVVRSWTACRVWIMDEIGMVSADLLTTLDRIARALTKRPNDPFGGIQLIAVGDFLQLPPVLPNLSAEGPIFAFESPSWAACGFRSVEFPLQYRHAQDDAFARMCRDLRLGYVSVAAEDALRACSTRKDATLYGEAPPTRIMPLRKQVESFNQEQLSLIDDPSFLRYEAEDQSSVPGLDLDSETPLIKSLVVKVGALVVAVAAVPNTPVRNGDVGVVVGFQEQSHGPPLPVVRLHNHNGDGDGGEGWAIGLVRVDVAGRGGSSIASRTQIPLQLAWALTVHRVQGMTLPAAHVTLDRSVFECGQAYVAVSRVRSLADLTVSPNFDVRAFSAHPKAVAFMQRTFVRSPAEVADEQARRDQDAFIRSSRQLQSSEGAPSSTKRHHHRHRKDEETGRSHSAAASIATPVKRPRSDDDVHYHAIHVPQTGVGVGVGVGEGPDAAGHVGETVGEKGDVSYDNDEVSVPSSPTARVASPSFERRAHASRSPGKRTAFSFPREPSVEQVPSSSASRKPPQLRLLMDDDDAAQ